MKRTLAEIQKTMKELAEFTAMQAELEAQIDSLKDELKEGLSLVILEVGQTERVHAFHQGDASGRRVGRMGAVIVNDNPTVNLQKGAIVASQ